MTNRYGLARRIEQWKAQAIAAAVFGCCCGQKLTTVSEKQGMWLVAHADCGPEDRCAHPALEWIGPGYIIENKRRARCQACGRVGVSRDHGPVDWSDPDVPAWREIQQPAEGA